MIIEQGQNMPEGNFTVMGSDGPTKVLSKELFDKKKVVLFAVPGAFTPACSASHLPGYVKNFEKIKGKGVDEVVCLSVNDVFVMSAWATEQAADSKVTMLADGNGDYVKSLGLQFDGSGFGLGMRSQRFAMIIDNGCIEKIFLEEAVSDVKLSSAENVIASL